MFPGTLLPVPILLRSAASRSVIAPNCACPSGRGGATDGTVMSWIIHPSYQPLSLLMTNKGEMSVKTSLKARGLFGSVGKPGFGLQNHAHGTECVESAIPPGGGQLHVPVIHPGDYGGKDVGLETIRVQQIVLEQLPGPVGFGEHL